MIGALEFMMAVAIVIILIEHDHRPSVSHLADDDEEEDNLGDRRIRSLR